MQLKTKSFFLRRTRLTTCSLTGSEKPPRWMKNSDRAAYFCLCSLAPSLSCLKIRHGTLLRRILFYWQRLRLCDACVDFHRRLLTHLIRDMGVGVQRSSCGYMAQDGRQRLNVHSVGEGIGSKGVAEIMEAYPFTSGMINSTTA